MKQRFRLYRRGANGRYYIQDNITGKQESLGTSDKTEATRLFSAKNEAEYQPAFNTQLAKTYLAAGDPAIGTRTWQDVIDRFLKAKDGMSDGTRSRYERSIKEPALDALRSLPLLQTRSETLLKVMEAGSISTNLFLRRLHSFALTVGWLVWPILAYRQWPRVRFKEKRGITWEEHRLLVDSEKNAERKAFLELLWHVGAAQIDLVMLKAEDVDWDSQTITYFRRKTGQPCALRFGEEVAAILRRLPVTGPLFPKYSTLSSANRAMRFSARCEVLGITERSAKAGIPGISLHSYRYAWAERARAAGYPERYAQEALGHKSAAIHRAYAKRARMELPPLEDYEREKSKLVALPKAA